MSCIIRPSISRVNYALGCCTVNSTIYRQASSKSDFEDIAAFTKLLSRVRRSPTKLNPQFSRFAISRFDDSERLIRLKELKIGQGLRNLLYSPSGYKSNFDITAVLKYCRFLLTTKALIYVFAEDLPNLEGLATGSKLLFQKLLNSVLNRNIESLSPFILGGAPVLKELKPKINKLTEVQRKALGLVSNEDFVGRDGLILNDCGFDVEQDNISRYLHNMEFVTQDAVGNPLDDKYLRYSVYVIALGKKKQLYKLVRLLPFTTEQERLHVSLPPDYGFPNPRYTVIHLELCHKMYKNGLIARVEEDCSLYDFHIINF